MQLELFVLLHFNCQGGNLVLPTSSFVFVPVVPVNRFVMCCICTAVSCAVNWFRIEHSGMHHGLLLVSFYRIHVEMELQKDMFVM